MTFGSFDEVREQVARLAEARGRVRPLGQWSPGQNLWHIARFMEGALDGFPNKVPAIVRAVFRALLLGRALDPARPLPSGFKLPKSAAYLIPPDEVSFDEGAERLGGVLDRLAAGERFTHPSPLFGDLSHEQWTTLQLKHAALHLGFLAIEPADVSNPEPGRLR